MDSLDFNVPSKSPKLQSLGRFPRIAVRGNRLLPHTHKDEPLLERLGLRDGGRQLGLLVLGRIDGRLEVAASVGAGSIT